MAFVPSLALSSTTALSPSASFLAPTQGLARRGRLAVTAPARGRARAPLRMCTPAPGEDGKIESPLPAAGVKTKAQEAEEEIVQTWQGNAWFAIIMGGMMIGVAATLARDFVDGGGPAVMM